MRPTRYLAIPARSLAMLRYLLILVGVSVLSEVAPEAGMGLFVLAAAFEWAAGRWQRSLGVCAAAAAAGLLLAGSLGGAAVYASIALLGVGMGMAFRRRWPLGLCVASVTSAVSAVVLSSMISQWSETRRQLTIVVNAWIARIEESGRQSGGANDALIEQFKWIDVQWACVGPGLIFGMVLLGATAALAFLAAMVRRSGFEAGPSTRFREMRPPEWLVWLAILVALLWFADRRWPNDGLRALTWNSALALTFIYGLNGLSIVSYALCAFQFGPAVAAAIAAIVLLSGAQALVPLGLFDTWWNFRRQVDRLVELRRMNGPSGPADA